MNYSEFPDAYAPRRFELLNQSGLAYGHGAAFINGFVVTVSRFQPFVMYPSLAAFLATCAPMRWLDPPFTETNESEEETEE